MDILTIILVIVAVGVFLWLINTYVPMQGTIKSLLNLIVIILLILWLLDAFGIVNVFGGAGRPVIDT